MGNRVRKPHPTSLHSLVKGFILTKATEGRSSHTVRYYEQIFRGFLWYADKQGRSDDARLLNEWHFREFLGYVATQTNRWGLSQATILLLQGGKLAIARCTITTEPSGICLAG